MMHMKKLRYFWGMFLVNFSIPACMGQYTNSDIEQLGWKLSYQAWTLKSFTFAESLDKMKEAGVKYIEMYPDQPIGGGLEGTTHFTMKKETREKLLALIQSKGMKLLNYGVVGAKDQAEWIELIEFAKAMGIETIVAEPDSLQLNFIEPLCVQYQIKVAIHNHPKPDVFGHPSKYWDPDYTMNQLSKRNQYIGVCADLGHWTRSGLDPLESLKKYEGKIFDVHAKDLVPGEGGFCGYHDVPWGTGISNFAGLMHELKRQGYKGTITIEYEYHWDNSMPEIIESISYLKRLAHWIGKE
jgi:sugar phosphate isomerase/epimerase